MTAFALVTGGALGLMWRSSDQQVRALVAADREIAARIAARAEFEQTAEFLENLVGSSPVATIVLDGDGSVLLWNPAAEAMFGWSADETVGRRLPAELTADRPSHRTGLAELIERSLAGTVIRDERSTARRRDGREVVVEIGTPAPVGSRPGRRADRSSR